MKKKIGLILIFFLVSLFTSSTSLGDGGLIGPPQIDVEENAQNAIVAWNGTQEVLILSVDTTTSQSSSVLRIVPLPSNPLEIKEGNFDSFTKLQNIVNEKLTRHYLNKGYGWDEASKLGNESGVEITYQDIIGAHNITVVKVNNLTFFVEWTKNFAMNKNLTNINFSDSFKNTVEDYLNKDIRHFVFDLIEANEIQQTVEPIIYRFNTTFLYYPLNITAFSDAGETYSTINVFIISEGAVKKDVISEYRYYFQLYINLTKEELNEISPDIYKLFEADPFLTKFDYYGKLSRLQKDILLTDQDFTHPKAGLEFEDTIMVESGKSKAVNVKVKNIGDEDLYVKLNIEGEIELKHSWFSIKPYSAWVEKGNETMFEIMYTLPSNIPAGEYNIRYVVNSYEYGEYVNIGEGNATLVVYESYEPIHDINMLKDEIGYLCWSVIANTIFMIIIFVVLFYLVLRKGFLEYPKK